jgi:hypothetical protein
MGSGKQMSRALKALDVSRFSPIKELPIDRCLRIPLSSVLIETNQYKRLHHDTKYTRTWQTVQPCLV